MQTLWLIWPIASGLLVVGGVALMVKGPEWVRRYRVIERLRARELRARARLARARR